MTNILTAASKSAASRLAGKAGLPKTRVLPTSDGKFAVYASPVAFMWAFLDLNGSDRKAATKALKEFGEFNPATVNTQVSRYFTAKGDRREWYKIDKARKADAATA